MQLRRLCHDRRRDVLLPASESVDCDGNCLVAVDCAGECGGSAVLDDCGVCSGPGAIYECGCSDIAEGDCDCDGNQLDALGVCGGACTADADEDGICDDVDDCVGAYDDCGVCNGRARSTSAAVLTLLKATATAMATSSTPLAYAEVPARRTRMKTAFVTTYDCVGAYDCGGNGPGATTTAAADIAEGACDCDGTSLTPLACAVVLAQWTDKDGIWDVDDCV